MGVHVVLRAGVDGFMSAFVAISQIEVASLSVYGSADVMPKLSPEEPVLFLDCTPSEEILTLLRGRCCGNVRILDNQNEFGIRERFLKYLKKEGLRHKAVDWRIAMDDLGVFCLSDKLVPTAQIATWCFGDPLPEGRWASILQKVASSSTDHGFTEAVEKIGSLLLCGCDVRRDVLELSNSLQERVEIC
jgi:hypothetical protein